MRNNEIKKQFNAPMAEICQNWQLSQQVGMGWYFEYAKNMGADKITFDGVKLGSDFFESLVETCERLDLTPEFAVPSQHLTDWGFIKKILNRRIFLSVLIHRPLLPDFMHALEMLENQLDQFEFHLIARSDWAYENCFRSLPSQVRDRLILDFPVSIHETDPFFKPSEVMDIFKDLTRSFPGNQVRVESSHLRLSSTLSKTNISHFSRPRKLTNQIPKLSIVISDPTLLESLGESSFFKSNASDIEILVARVAGEKTRVIPNIKSVVTTRLWAHPIESHNPISKQFFENYSVLQADGQIILFLDEFSKGQVDSLLSALLSEHLDTLELSKTHRVRCFKKNDFLQVGGFDPLIKHSILVYADFLYRLHLLAGKKLDLHRLISDFGMEELNSDESFRSQIMLSKYLSNFEDFKFFANKPVVKRKPLNRHWIKDDKLRYRMEWTRDFYLSLYNATPKVALEGHFVFLKIQIQSSKIYWKIKDYFNPKTYKLYWKLKYLPGRLHLFLFTVSKPIRKVYYFLHYQYEKRVLGLHSSEGLRG